jgi:hypothetical protein
MKPNTCRHCSSNRIVGEGYEGMPLGWMYRRDVLGEDWPTRPDLSNALCYLCYIREVLQWAAECTDSTPNQLAA